MGLSSFVGSILGGRGARASGREFSLGQSEQTFPIRSSPRRRGGMRMRDRSKDRGRDSEHGTGVNGDWKKAGEIMRSSSSHQRYESVRRPCHDDPRLCTGSDRIRSQLHPDFEQCDGLLFENTVSSRPTRDWRRGRYSVRIKSNVEDVPRDTESAVRSYDFRRHLGEESFSAAQTDNIQRCHQCPSRDRLDSRTLESDGSHSLKRLLMRTAATGSQGICHDFSGTGPQQDTESPTSDATCRANSRTVSRIRSNLEQLMRREKESVKKWVARPSTSTGKRHSLVTDAPTDSSGADVSGSVVNGFVHGSDMAIADDDSCLDFAVPAAGFSNTSLLRTASDSHAEEVTERLTTPVTVAKVDSGIVLMSSSASSTSTGSTSSTNSSSRTQRRSQTELWCDLDEDVPQLEDANQEQERVHAFHHQPGYFPSVAATEPHARLSADAVYPMRCRAPPSFSRSHSSPTAPMQESTLPTRVGKRRPPPLRTPTEDATGFACGVGLSSGIRGVPLGSNHRDSGAEITTSHLRDGPAGALGPGKDYSSKQREGSNGIETANCMEAKKHSRFDLWSSEPSQNCSSGGSRFSHKYVEKEEDLFHFEEASQSSFGDNDTSNKYLTTNSSECTREQRGIAEVQEDQFVFGADGSFNDGGFIISSNGLVEAPERLMRKTSDGVAVEGVPSSSNNIIFVKSLDEFRKSYTFRSSSEDGSSTLGRGSAGRVYLASHRPTGCKIAVKEINVYDEEKRKQLRKELQTLINHQSRFLVRSFGAFYDGAGAVHVTLEFMDTGSLADIVLQRGKIPEPVVSKLMEHCLRGLSFLHENHILHRDVKTANILLSRKLCRAKLSDFGLARDFETDNKSKADSFVGTLAYMSPERLHGRIYTYASDIWSVGITVMECVMGKFPFEKPQSYFDIVDAAQSDPAFLVQGEEVSQNCLDFIRLCLQPEMRDRPTARDLLRHDWIKSRLDDANVLREWLETVPRLHCEDVDIGSELAFNAREKRRARLEAKAKDFK